MTVFTKIFFTPNLMTNYHLSFIDLTNRISTRLKIIRDQGYQIKLNVALWSKITLRILLIFLNSYVFPTQLKVYFDITALQLLVTVVSASGLSPRVDGSPRCPYAKIFLLPDKSEKSKRRTKTLANTLEPRWNQTFVYCGIRITDIKKRTLEVSRWLWLIWN